MEKGYKKMWEFAEIPVYVVIVWSIAAIILAGMGFIGTTVQAVLGYIIIIAAFVYVGFMVKKAGETTGYAAKTGAFAGAITGFAGGILGIISFYYFPAIYTEAINQAVAQGAPADMTRSIITIGVYVGLITGPIFSALIGAGLSALGSLLARN